MPVRLSGRLEFEDLVAATFRHVRAEDDRLLVVFDSLSTIAEFMVRPKGGVWELLADIQRWMETASARSEGRIGWLAISEQNRDGEVKGVKLKYLSDVVVKMVNTDSETDHVELDVVKSRDGGGGKLGTFYRDWRQQRFLGKATP